MVNEVKSHSADVQIAQIRQAVVNKIAARKLTLEELAITSGDNLASIESYVAAKAVLELYLKRMKNGEIEQGSKEMDELVETTGSLDNARTKASNGLLARVVNSADDIAEEIVNAYREEIASARLAQRVLQNRNVSHFRQ